jgi:hypothetical protein
MNGRHAPGTNTARNKCAEHDAPFGLEALGAPDKRE